MSKVEQMKQRPSLGNLGRKMEYRKETEAGEKCGPKKPFPKKEML